MDAPVLAIADVNFYWRGMGFDHTHGDVRFSRYVCEKCGEEFKEPTASLDSVLRRHALLKHRESHAATTR